MKKLIIFVQHMTDGGAERVLSELIGYWSQHEVNIILAEIEPDMFANSYPLPSGIQVIKFKTDSKSRMARYLAAIRFMVKVMRENPDTPVLAFNKLVIYKLVYAALFTKNKIIVSERNDPYSTPRKSRRWLRNWAFLRADRCVFQTPGARDYFPESVKKKSVIIPNPVNSALPDRFEGERDKSIIAVGRLDPQKNFPMLIRAFALLHRDFPDYRLFIFGRGQQEEELKQLAGEFNVSEHVFFPGFSDSIYQEMVKCAIYVSSSDYEGISNSMLEALAMGIPSVCTDCPSGGARMVIENNVNGILTPVGDERAMYEGMKKILSDDAFARSIGEEAYKIRGKYPIEKIAQLWIEVLFN